jgi:hypothetical protein
MSVYRSDRARQSASAAAIDATETVTVAVAAPVPVVPASVPPPALSVWLEWVGGFT